jgi:hypothetical protein
LACLWFISCSIIGCVCHCIICFAMYSRTSLI